MRSPSLPRPTEKAAPGVESRATTLLREYWGHEHFRPGQLAAIQSIAEKRDTLIVLPTGGGKSICFQIGGLLLDGVTLVLSPLLSLMRDQVESLQAKGIEADRIDSTQSIDEQNTVFRRAAAGACRFLYVAPERLKTRAFARWSSHISVGLIAVDEAHCISEWGHNFRPAYRAIPDVYGMLGNAPVAALTATATPAVKRDISKNLRLRTPVNIFTGFDRPNLVFSVFRTFGRTTQLRRILNAVSGAAVVYASTRASVDRWARALREGGFRTVAYHAGLAHSERDAAQAAWISNSARILVATSAFGMGIDKPDVRSVTHVGLPTSLENYYQEAGRAGRDGKNSYATLLTGEEDIERHVNLAWRIIDDTSPNRGRLVRLRKRRSPSYRYAWRARKRMLEMIAYASSDQCRRQRLLAHFGEYMFHSCGSCDVCLGRHRPMVITPRHEHMLRSLLKSTFERYSALDDPKFIRVPEYRIHQMIEWLVHEGFLSWPTTVSGLLELTRPGHSTAVEDSVDPVREYIDGQIRRVH